MRKSKLLLASALVTPAIIHNAAYANTLTRLIPDLYAGLDVVSRELVGFIPGVSRNASAERAAVGQSVVWPVVPQMAAYDIAPAMTIPEPPDITVGNDTMTITKSRAVPFGWTGEEQRGLNANGPGYLSVQADMFAQGLRTLTNEVESDLAIAAAAGASRAWGTAGTVPFNNDKTTDAAQLRKILDDNGAPASGRSLVGNTSMGARLREIYQLTKVNEAGTMMTLRDGQLLDLHGFSVRESAQVVNHTKGTGDSATTSGTALAVGTTSIPLASAGTGTIVAGDTITFAGDTNKYQVVTGDTDVSNGGTLVIAKPGLRVAIPASATAITVVASATQNVAFTQDALQLAARQPALPNEGDAALDRIQVTDPRSGLVFEVSLWAGYRKVRAEVALAWGVKASKTQHIALLLG